MQKQSRKRFDSDERPLPQPTTLPVLVIEDDPKFVEYLGTTLERGGCLALASLRMGMSGRRSSRLRGLRHDGRSSLDWLHCRSQRDQGCTDDDKDSHADQFSA